MMSFLKEVAADLHKRFGPDLKDVAIVFNNKRPILFLKKHLGQLAGTAFWSPDFFTIGQFVSESSDLLVADHIQQFFILHREYNRILALEGSSQVAPDVFYPMAEIILADFSQIDYDLADSDHLFSELFDIAVIQQQFSHFTEEQQQFLERFWASFSAGRQEEYQQKFIDLWRRLPVLYKAFHQHLGRTGLSTTANLYREFALEKISKPRFYDKYKQVVFVGFNALNKAEAKLFMRLQEEGKALFYFDADDYYLNDNLQEAGLFIRRNLKQHGLINAFKSGHQSIALKTNKVDIIQSQGHTSQAKAVEDIVLSSLEHINQDDPESVAIIIADESLLIPVLQSIPSQYGKVNVTMGFPLAQSTVFGFVDLWLSVQEQLNKEKKDTVYYRDVEAFLSHPLTSVREKERELLQKVILDNQMLEVPLSELLFATDIAPNFFTIKHEGLQCIDALYVLLTAALELRQKRGMLQQLEASMILAVSTKLNLLYDSLAEYASGVPMVFVLSLIRKTLQGLSVPLEGEPLKGIQVMGLLESRCLDFQKVVILGVNEGVMPKLNISPTFIPDSIRRVYGLPVIENQDAISAYLFYRLLHRTTDLSLVYNTLVDETNTGEPSRFIRQLEFESRLKFNYRQQEQPVSIEPRPPLSVPKTGKVWHALERFLQAGENEKISATAITTYMSCPLQFFYRYVARIREPEVISENLEANQIGSVFHQVMEWFYKDLSKQSSIVTAHDIQLKRKDIKLLCKQALSKELFNTRDRIVKANSMQQIILRIVEEYVHAVLLHDEQVAPFRIIELENKEDYKYRFPIEVKGGAREVLLYGIIDRVDEKNGVTRIVDYKTGSRDEVKFTCLDDLFEPEGKKQNKAMVQTLFYTFIYEQVKNLQQIEPNLYIIRKMKDDGTLFFTGGRGRKVQLQAEHLEDLKSGFQVQLKSLLEELFNPDIPFTDSVSKVNCGYCPYKEICQG
ncbi:PD-(D/E)XK nuclease family protein [Flavihumibacter sp. R14]|nr:PD-(D/E)XK nuclease family protein [Flavihumibacter soli]